MSDKKLFLGRAKPMADAKETLNRWHKQQDDLPHVAMIWGQGGIGKTTVVSHIHSDIIKQIDPAGLHASIDWDKYFAAHPDKDQSLAIWPGQVLGIFLTEVREQLGFDLDHYEQFEKDLQAAEIKLAKRLPTGPQASQPGSSESGKKGNPSLGEHAADLAIDAANAATGLSVFKSASKLVVSLISKLGGPAVEKEIASLSAKEQNLLRMPHKMRAQAIGKDIRSASLDQGWIATVTMDTYEHVARHDALFREIIVESGPGVAWIVAGRDDLANGFDLPGGQEKGYAAYDEEHWHLTEISLKQLAMQHLAEILKNKAPARAMPDDAELDKIYKATKGIPFAMGVAAKIWANGKSIEEITEAGGQATDEIAFKMVDRYLKHCVPDDADWHALAAVAMANRDPDLLRAMLEPELDEGVCFEARIEALRLRHAALQLSGREGLHLHDDAAYFFTDRLMGPWRCDQWVKTFAERGLAVCRQRMAERQHRHVRLMQPPPKSGEPRDQAGGLCTDQKYAEASALAVHLLVWIDEAQAERLLTLRVVEALPHHPELGLTVLRSGNPWGEHLDEEHQYRRGLMQKVLDRPFYASGDSHHRLSRLLDDDKQRKWLPAETLTDGQVDRWAAERDAIRHWFAARALLREEQLEEALKRVDKACDAAERCEHLPGATLASISDLAVQIVVAFCKVKDYEQQRAAAKTAVRADPHSASAHTWMSLGYSDLNEHERALEHSLKALRLDKTDSFYFTLVGGCYTDLGEHQKALNYCLKAIELDNTQPANWVSVSRSLSWLGRNEEALEHAKHAVTLSPDDANLLRIYADRLFEVRRYVDAEAQARRALSIEPEDLRARVVIERLRLHRGQTNEGLLNKMPQDDIYINHWAVVVALASCIASKWEDASNAFAALAKSSPTTSAHRIGYLAASRCADPDFSPDPAWIEETRWLTESDIDPFGRALLAAMEGDAEEALKRLPDAIKYFPARADEARLRPEFLALREDPRFQEMTRPLEE